MTRYLAVAEELHREIERRPAETNLPTERELAKRFGGAAVIKSKEPLEFFDPTGKSWDEKTLHSGNYQFITIGSSTFQVEFGLDKQCRQTHWRWNGGIPRLCITGQDHKTSRPRFSINQEASVWPSSFWWPQGRTTNPMSRPKPPQAVAERPVFTMGWSYAHNHPRD